MRRNTKLLIGAVIIATIALMAMSMGSATAEKIAPGEVTDDYTGEKVMVEGQVVQVDRSDGVQFTIVGNSSTSQANVPSENSSTSLQVYVPSDVDVPPTLEEDRIAVIKGTYTEEGLRAYDITVRAHQTDGQG